jgi:glutaminase
VLFRGLSEAEGQRLAAAMSRRVLPAGEWVFRQGEPADALFVLVRGSVSIIGEDHAARLQTLSPGLMFGELAVLDGGQRSAGVRADAEAEVHVLTASALQQLRAADPALSARLYENIAAHVSDRLRKTTQSWTAEAG